MKAQSIRVADVVFVGPVMIAGGVALNRAKRQGLGALLVGLGLATIVYNGVNFLKQHKRLTSKRQSPKQSSTAS